MGLQLSLWVNDFVSFRCIPRNGTAGSCVIFLIIWGTSILFSTGSVPVYTFHHQCPPVPSSLTRSAFISGLLDNRHSNRCEVTSCGLICLSMMCSDIEHISSSTCWPFVYLLWKNICLSSLPISKLDYLYFYYWVIWVLSIFWMLTPSLSDRGFTNIFFPYYKLPFHFVDDLFAMQKLLEYLLCSIDWCVCFMPILYCFDYCSFII